MEANRGSRRRAEPDRGRSGRRSAGAAAPRAASPENGLNGLTRLAPSRIDMLLGFIAQKPSDPFPRYALALEYKNAGRLDEARAVFGELMSLCPDYTATYLHAGDLLSKMGLKEDARSVFQTGIT